MIKWFAQLGLFAAILVVSTGTLWISGEILLPAMGLTNPDWTRWLIVLLVLASAHTLVAQMLRAMATQKTD